MSLEGVAKLAIGSVLLFFILTAVVSIFVTVLSILFGAVLILATIGFITMLMSGIASTVDNEGKEEEQTEDKKETMSQQERIEVLKRKYLEGEITEDEFEQLVDRELDRQKEKSVEYSRQNIF